jgi:hypothetical protein
MTYFVYIAHHDNRPKDQRWGTGEPIAFVDFVKGRKDGADRLERICERFPEVLPQEGWSRLTHRKLGTDDNSVIEKLKNEIRVRLSALSTAKSGDRRLWARKPKSPAGCYRLEFFEVNKVVTDAIHQSGLYRPGG